MPAENAPTPQRHEHISQLRNGGVGQNFLDIGLRDADGCGEECGQGSDDGNYGQGEGARSKITCDRETIYTPAVTMVAA